MLLKRTIKDGEEHFVMQLKEYARMQDVPIDETLWNHPAYADTAELTVVSNRKSYILSLQPTDLTDPQRGKDLVRMLLTAIRQNIPFLRVRR
jgi:hypothetical protein